MKKLAFILILLSVSIPAFSDCSACWTLTPVSLKLKNQKEILGYVKWSDVWIENKVGDFQTDFLRFHTNRKFPVILYHKIVFYNHLFPGSPFAPLNTTDTIATIEIKEIKKRKDEYADVSRAGDINSVSPTQDKYFKRTPFAVYKLEGTVSEDTYMSYNPKITKEKLIEISKYPT